MVVVREKFRLTVSIFTILQNYPVCIPYAVNYITFKSDFYQFS